jgi:hypothetical protein
MTMFSMKPHHKKSHLSDSKINTILKAGSRFIITSSKKLIPFPSKMGNKNREYVEHTPYDIYYELRYLNKSSQ